MNEKDKKYLELLTDEDKKTAEEIAAMSHAEFQEHWLNLSEKYAKVDPYCKELLEMAKKIIDEKDYSHLYNLLEAYDRVFKELMGLQHGIKYKDREYPFWCYALCKPEEQG